eukprot:1632805-Lingulodinium_polyedra.AAC.1
MPSTASGNELMASFAPLAWTIISQALQMERRPSWPPAPSLTTTVKALHRNVFSMSSARRATSWEYRPSSPAASVCTGAQERLTMP